MSDSPKTPASSPAEPWINSAAACRHLGISKVTLRRWICQGAVTARRTPNGDLRFRRSELDRVLV